MEKISVVFVESDANVNSECYCEHILTSQMNFIDCLSRNMWPP